MPQREPFAEHEFYHLYNRGVEKRDIFLDTNDYNRFIALLYISNSANPVHLQLQGRTLNELLNVERGEQLVDICTYCLMPNHYHLLVRERTEFGISKFIQKLSTAYTMYFNKFYERSGALFQGKFKSVHVSSDPYLKYLISYIHLNPVELIDPKWKENAIANRSKAKNYLSKYRYSSYLDFLGIQRDERRILASTSLPQYFKALNSFEAEVDEWLSFPG